MDTGIKVAIFLGLLGSFTWLADFLFKEDITKVSKRGRLAVFVAGLIFLIAAVLVLLLWPVPRVGIGPRLEVRNVEPAIPTGENIRGFNIYLKNTGDRAADAVSWAAATADSTAPVSKYEEDDAFERLSKQDPVKSGNEIEAGQSNFWFSVPASRIPLDIFKRAIDGSGGPVYVMLYLKYQDGNSSVITESCVFFWQKVVHNCNGHNKIYLLHAKSLE